MVDNPQPPSTPMEGFGSADLTTPFHYGSVYDGNSRSESLEKKLKKQYWKTKQTVIQKLGKNQDEFIVAGDAEIDTKLEKAYHLQSSCSDLLQAIHKYISRLRTVSLQESVMGEHLRTWSETEYTNAGEVMQNVGKLQDKDSKSRYQLISPLLRMHGEFTVFRDTAVRDLNNSIQSLERGRTEYRAALLWMKDVSDKLHNPDYRDQLVRYREAQATVKDAKRRFEKLKVDLGEKIDMVSASRCNLLSRSLPNYQKEVLDYSDTIANEFHNLLVDLRTHHHHQYKVRRVLEEIRDLEADELPLKDQPGEDGDEFSSLKLPELDQRRPLFDGDDDPLLDLGAEKDYPDHSLEEDSRKPPPVLPEVDNEGVNLQESQRQHEEKVQEPFRRVGDPFSFEQVAEQAKVKDLVLGGIEAELQALQNEVLNPRESSSAVPQRAGPGGEGVAQSGGESAAGQSLDDADGDIDELLKLEGEDLADEHSTMELGPNGSNQHAGPQDNLVSEWDNFSAFMPSTRDHTKSPLSGWEQELMNSAPPADDNILTPSPVPAQNSAPVSKVTTESTTDKTPQVSTTSSTGRLPPNSPPGGNKEAIPHDISVDELLGIGARSADKADSGAADQLLSEELQSLGLSPPKSQGFPQENKSVVPASQLPAPSSSGLTSVDPALFQLHSTQAQPPTTAGTNGSQVSPFRSPLGMSQYPPVFPTQGSMGMVMAPPKFGLVSPTVQGVTGPSQLSAAQGAAKGNSGGKEGEKGQKGTAWMNFFAHLDPLVNEKA